LTDQHSSEDPQSAGVSGYAAFRYRDFRLFLIGRAIGYGAHQMFLVVIGYQIYDQTGDPISLALVNLTMVAPVFLCFPVTGTIADMFDRSRVLALGYAVTAIGATSLSVVSALNMPVSWVFYALFFIIAFSRAIYAPTSNAFVAALVPREVFPNALAWNASIAKITQIGGPAAGGFLYLAGPEWAYGLTAGCFVIGMVANVMINPRAVSATVTRFDANTLFAGFRYILVNRIILGAMAVDLLVVFMGNVAPLLPIFAKDILDVGSSGAGILRSALAGGGLLAAISIAHVSVGTRAGAKMLISAAVFGCAIVVFGLSKSFLLSVVSLVVLGAADMTSTNIRQTLLQIATPDALRGRVSAANSLSSNTGSELGGFRAGLFVAAFGPVGAVAIGGLAVVATALASFRIFPALAGVDRLDRVPDQPPEPRPKAA
jgi:MFS family permease